MSDETTPLIETDASRKMDVFKDRAKSSADCLSIMWAIIVPILIGAGCFSVISFAATNNMMYIYVIFLPAFSLMVISVVIHRPVYWCVMWRIVHDVYPELDGVKVI